MGFNTALPGAEAQQRAVWNELIRKVKDANAKMVYISNAFSFKKSDKKPGSIDPQSSPFCNTMKTQAPDLWKHLFHAGALESCLFACDQMAKWLADKGVEPKGHDGKRTERKPELIKKVEDCCMALELKAKNEKEDVSKALKAMIDEGDDGVAKVLRACEDLHSAAEDTCGPEKAEYLRRALAALENFGHTVEITDGQQFLVLYQSNVPVLKPVVELTWLENIGCLTPKFDGGTTADRVGIITAGPRHTG